MALDSIYIPEDRRLLPVITAIGVGGAGCNAIQNMHDKKLQGVEFIVANTDAQSLENSTIAKKLQLGPKTAQGLGAGSDPSVGQKSTEEVADQIKEFLEGAHMLFITAGMGGGTGTGAAPVIARIAREMGILTIGVVTKPFVFEGAHRLTAAEEGIEELRRNIHTSVVIPNQNLFQVSNENTTTAEAFMKADDVLYEGVKSITDLMVKPGKINLDFADVRSILMEMGSAMMGTGEDGGENRAKIAATRAMTNQLLEETRLKLAKAVLINIIGGDDMTLFDLNEASDTIRKEIDPDGSNPDARIIIGSSTDPEYNGKVKVSLLAAGLNVEEINDGVKPEIIEPLPTDEIWELEPEVDDRDDEDHFDEHDIEEFEPTTLWPHSQVGDALPVADELAASSSSDALDSDGASQTDIAVATSAESGCRQFVAPKASNDSGAVGLQVVGSVPSESTEEQNRDETDGHATNQKQVGRLRSVVQRMKPWSGNSVETPSSDSMSEPSFGNGQFPFDANGYNESDRFEDERRRTPAFMRRQAN